MKMNLSIKKVNKYGFKFELAPSKSKAVKNITLSYGSLESNLINIINKVKVLILVLS